MACPFRYISGEEAEKVLSENLSEFVEVTKKTFVEYSSKRCQQPLRSWIKTTPRSGLIAMPGYIEESKALAIKLLSYSPKGYAGVVALFNSETSVIEALIDSHIITEYRTTSMSVAAALKLANPESRILTVFGTGHQARRHALMMCDFFPISEIRIWNYREESAHKLVGFLKEQLQGRDIEISFIPDGATATAGSDVVVTATNAHEAVLKGVWLKKGCFLAAVGAANPEYRELDDDVVLTNEVYVDTMDGCLAEAGDLIQTKCQIKGEIGEILDGENLYSENKIQVFKSVGMAVQDVASAKFINDKLAS